MKRVITFGTFDIFHVGHKRLLERASKYGDYLIVGVSSDYLNLKKKNRLPIYPLSHRLEIIQSLSFVDEVFIEESLEYKSMYIINFSADILIMGDDWYGKMDIFKNICDVIYIPRTPSISTTEIIEKIKY